MSSFTDTVELSSQRIESHHGRLRKAPRTENTSPPVCVTPELLQQIWATLPCGDDEFLREDDGS